MEKLLKSLKEIFAEKVLEIRKKSNRNITKEQVDSFLNSSLKGPEIALKNNLIDKIDSMEGVFLDKFSECKFRNTRVKFNWSMLKSSTSSSYLGSIGSMIANPFKDIEDKIELDINSVCLNEIISNIELDFLSDIACNNLKMNNNLLI